MRKETRDMLIFVGVSLWVALPDIIPFLGDFLDAGVVAGALQYFKSQAAVRFPDDARFSRDYGYDGRRMERDDHYVPRRNDIVDVECRRVR